MLTIYKGRGGFRWTLRARNGKIIGASTEGYVQYRACARNIRRVLNRIIAPPLWRRGATSVRLYPGRQQNVTITDWEVASKKRKA